MFTLARAPLLYERSGLILLLLQLSLFVFGLPPLHAGLFAQTEPVALATYVFAMLACLWLALGTAKTWLRRTQSHPLFLALLAWTLWQFIPTLLALSPWRSWFGPAQTGEGTAWHVAFLTMFCLAYPLWQTCRPTLIFAACANIAIACALYLLHERGADGLFLLDEWTPVQWPSFLAFEAIYLAIATTPKTRSVYALLAIVLLISHNRSAMVLGGGAIMISALAFTLKLPVTRLWRAGAVAACALPLVWVMLSNTVSHIAPFNDKNGGLGARIVLNQVALSTLAHEPARLLTGGGWGRFNDDIFKYMLVDGITVYDGNERKPNSFLVDGGAFHSHSQPLEALLSLGIPGLLLWLALPMIAIATLPKQHFWPVAPLLVALTTLGFFWFQLLECLPYQALAFVALCTAKPPSPPTASRGWAPVFLLVALMMGLSAAAQAKLFIYDERLKIMAATGDYTIDDDALSSDMFHGGERIRAIVPFYVKHILTPAQAEGYVHFSRAVSKAAESPNIGADAAFLDLWLHYFTLNALADEPLMAGAVKEAKASFADTVTAMEKRAPLRTDIAVPQRISP